MRQLFGVGTRKQEAFVDEFLACIAEYVNARK